MPSSAQHDVAVVGGSAAGLYTALELARKGRGVALYESAPRISALPRTLIVTHHFRKMLGPLAESSIVNEIRQLELFTDGRTATISLREPDLIIERASLIRSLAAECERAGVGVFAGHQLTGFDQSRGGVALQLERPQGTLHVAPQVIVGADGAFSAVAKLIGRRSIPTVPLVQAVVALPSGFPLDTTRVWFVPDDTPYFYWLIPESPGRGVLGLIAEDGRRARQCLQRFLIRQRLRVIEYQAARIPVYERWTPVHHRLGSSDVYLVGDAAGHVKVTTVGGIVTGFRGAAGVVQAVLQGQPGSELRALRRELDLHLRVRRTLHRFTLNDYCRLVDLLSAPILGVLGSISRDEARRVVTALCLRQPRLLLMGFRTLIDEWMSGCRPLPRRPRSAEALRGGGNPARPIWLKR